MANLIGWGKIYESSSWGVGVINNIGWGVIYREDANPRSVIVSSYIERVELDGGTVEAINCLKSAFPYESPFYLLGDNGYLLQQNGSKIII